jgi:hypothetical protein
MVLTACLAGWAAKEAVAAGEEKASAAATWKEEGKGGRKEEGRRPLPAGGSGSDGWQGDRDF